jgi:hypothetical protein
MTARVPRLAAVFLCLAMVVSNVSAEIVLPPRHDWRVPIGDCGLGVMDLGDTSSVCIVITSFTVPLPGFATAAILVMLIVGVGCFLFSSFSKKEHNTAA